MKIFATAIDGVSVIETTPFIDQRGGFYRFFCERDLDAVIGSRHIKQINFSRTLAVGAVRGLHFQYPPHAEMKLVRCLKGRAWDVIVDLRAGSPTFLKWHAEELSPENSRMMVIPEGCAHGFQVLDSDTELLYLHTEFYNPQAEGGVVFNDPTISINWPLQVTEVTDRDLSHPMIIHSFEGILI